MFLALLFPYVLSNFYRASLAVMASDLSRDLRLDAAGLASLQAVLLLGFALAQVPVALLLDRLGPRRILITGLAAAVAGSALLSLATTAVQGMLAMALIGVGFAPVLMAGFYLIARIYAPARFATMSSLLFGFGILGDPLSGAPLTLAVDAFGWRAAVLGLTAITALSLAVVALVLRDPPRIEAPTTALSPWSATRQVFAIRALWPILPLAFVSYAAVAATRGLWIAPYLASVHHLGPAEIGVSATAMGIAIAAGAILFAPLNRVVGDAKHTVVAGCALTAVGWLLLGFVGSQATSVAVGLLLAIGGFGASFAIVVTHARSFLPAHLLGQGVTMINLVFFCGASFVQWLSGLYVRAAESAAVAPPEVFARLFTGFGVVLAIAAGCYLLTPRERQAAPREPRPGGPAS